MRYVLEPTGLALKPEAAYFAPQDGQRCCLMVFDLEDPSQIPVIVEPMFLGAKAKITLTPCMNLEELQRGLSKMNTGESGPGGE